MNKTLWILIIVLLAIGGYYWTKSGDSTDDLGSVTKTTTSPSASPAKSSGGAKTTTTVTPTVSPKTYTQLVAEYKDRRVQFNADCQATPSSFVLKNNTSILLDNRANIARTLTVDGKAYSLVAYGYQIVNLSSPSVPKTVNISCGSSVNVSSILLEANISGQ